MNLLQDIRSKYVGTAEEHALLADLAKDEQRAFERHCRNHEEELASLRLNAQEDQKIASNLLSGKALDIAVFNWLQDPVSSWNLEKLSEAMLGRGLTSDNLRKVLTAVEAEEAKRESATTKEPTE